MSIVADVGVGADLDPFAVLASLPDPAELDAIAQRIAEHAVAARARAALLDQVLGATTWQGRAASAFGSQAGYVLVGLRRSAARLDDAADALRRHAIAVRHLTDSLTRLQADLPSVLDGIGDITSGVASVAHLIGIG